jgi:GNAT superfamily N-acetyltransferase
MTVKDRVRLTEATIDDAEALAEISKKAFDTDIDVGSPGGGGPPGYDEPEFQVRVMDYFDCYRILLDDETVGGIYVASKTPGHKVLERIFVDPDHHRQGIGTQAMKLAMERYPEAKLWTLGTPDWNVRTTAFYEKLGFVQVGWEHAEPEFKGRWYEKTIDPSQPYEMTLPGELKDGMKDVDVEGEILEKGVAREVRSRRRRWQTLSVANAGFGDDSGRIVLVLWNEQIKQVKVGDRVRIENGYVSSYRGINQLNVGRAGRLIHLI